jgi:hypothetical protein
MVKVDVKKLKPQIFEMKRVCSKNMESLAQDDFTECKVNKSASIMPVVPSLLSLELDSTTNWSLIRFRLLLAVVSLTCDLFL